jgi:hypothetical protein
MGEFVNRGIVEYKPGPKIYVCKIYPNETKFNIEVDEIDFQLINEQLKNYLDSIGFGDLRERFDWGSEIIAFLKFDLASSRAGQVISVKSQLMADSEIKTAVIAQFIQYCEFHNRDVFSNILKIYTGILIEDFVNSVAEIKSYEPKNAPTVYLDTALIMRILGCSGYQLKNATLELVRMLQDMGANTRFLPDNEQEVFGILDAIVQKKDTGSTIVGESAEAIISGEVSISHFRILQNGVADELAKLSIFPSEEVDFSSDDVQRFQISEGGLAQHIRDEAKKKGVRYKYENSRNDSEYVAHTVIDRRGHKSRDFFGCKFAFLTTNKFLVRETRRFLISAKELRQQFCSPVLSVSQVATILWLTSDSSISPERASRELISQCYSAYPISGEWFKNFLENIESSVGSAEEMSSDSRRALVLRAARRIAKEESLGHPAIVKSLDAAEILARAELVTDKEKLRLASEHEKNKIAYGIDKVANFKSELAERLAKIVASGLMVTIAILGALISINYEFFQYYWINYILYSALAVVAFLATFFPNWVPALGPIVQRLLISRVETQS